MTPALEDYLWITFRAPNAGGPVARDVIRDMVAQGMIDNEKQAYRTLEKWADAGCYEYGTFIGSGWKTQFDRPERRGQ